MHALRVDTDWVLEVLRDLVQINSINPCLDASGPGEAEVAAYVARRMGGLGLVVEVHEAAPGRPSVVAVLPGTGGGRSLAFNAHLDTVDVAGMGEPFGAVIRAGRLYGRGAFDMKGSLAGCMGALKALLDSGFQLRGDVELHAVADEEHSSLGTYDILGRRHVDAAIVTEPTALAICVAHKGFVWLDVEVRGYASHGSQWQLGIDANARMGRFLVAFERAAEALRSRRVHPLLGPASMHAALLRGGSGRSTYAANATVSIERRTLPGETADDAIREIQALIDGLHADDPSFEASITTILVRPSFEAARKSAVVESLASAITARTQVVPAQIGENPWMDASLYAERGTDTVVFGATGAGAHASEEWVDLRSVVTVAECLAQAAVHYCDLEETTQVTQR